MGAGVDEKMLVEAVGAAVVVVAAAVVFVVVAAVAAGAAAADDDVPDVEVALGEKENAGFDAGAAIPAWEGADVLG